MTPTASSSDDDDERRLGRNRTSYAQSWRATQAGMLIDGRQLPFPTLARGKNEWAQVWRARRPREELDFALLQKRRGAPAGV